ncbi:putative serine-threonine dehydratase [Leptomonas pyrrhocoris]|uniref:Putative serine-threonine dehydratase n=1 Tax=Leptomonas pyrrhocoris TaxID=157538 RepID=A0A0N0VGL5_LEPPY|nr:putative serine-threonine dehydratase [Leptomonas pyrrhocoris]XP_015662121.1 putative serine-threonine dehydratase [Leptomonas pyrrhocoris]XP_015662122.1 putative serine-threonine dehydratase [Leptomonas pyrrhocoris]KPA83681.1 putative serine-threonine dehydratase [Leptomonas pyrrhocoris]KPA83682.1 putative serine-threonine dehydratase [Leptomonas pyrrhocoris]KPA83683.1 putative serine-threonine dehydratase [Leptomonas pyrrhocoris]|eukprot:XP_015662120.1 putative serine-threonine dehydratase [Leptomonas pyrrhocoris]
MPTVGEIMSARKALDGYVYETPMIASNALRGKTRHESVMLKCENLQRTGSYHIRGMTYRVIRAKEADLGINNFITHSSGNGGAALACAASNFQSKAHVVVPEDTNSLITRSIHHYQGNFYYCKPDLKSRVEEEAKLLEEFNRPAGKQQNRAIVINPYDDEAVITGHGTAGIELMLQTDCAVDCVVAPVGGGALVSGVAIAVKGMKPHVGVFAAELADPPNHYTDFKRGESLAARQQRHGLSHHEAAAKGNRHGIRTPLTDLATRYIDRYVDGVIHVTPEEMKYAFRYVYERCKLVVDTNAAIAVAAVLSCPPALDNYRRVCVVLSGGNVDLNDIPKLAVSRL